MLTLKFIVSGQSIVLDPECDTRNLVPGSNGYIQAAFTFSSEWDGFTKVVGFYSNLGTEYPPQVLKSGEVCTIPYEALKKSVFKVKVFGKKDDYSICTNKVIVHQKGGKV
jgi:hypothetical protein